MSEENPLTPLDFDSVFDEEPTDRFAKDVDSPPLELEWRAPHDEDGDKRVRDIIRAAIEQDDKSVIEKAAWTLVDIECGNWDMTDTFIIVASFVPYNSPAQDNLVVLAFAIQSAIASLSPAVTPDEMRRSWNRVLSVEGHLSEYMVEAFHGRQGIVSGGLRETPEETIARMKYRNWQAFGARLYREGIHECDHYSDLYEFESIDFSGALPALKINSGLDWLDIAGEKVFEQTKQGYGGPRPQIHTLYAGSGPRLNLDRWQFWALRLASFSHDEKRFAPNTRTRAANAAQRITARFGNPSEAMIKLFRSVTKLQYPRKHSAQIIKLWNEYEKNMTTS